jgi:curved DNA-binding protein CbpA
MRTHYESLHVTEDAPDEVIRASYRALSLKHHPDTAGDHPHSRRRMQEINDAYAVLSDEAQRTRYDQNLRHARNPPPQPAAAPRQNIDAAPPYVPPVASRRQRHLQRMLPQIASPGLLGWLCDARIVLPVLAFLWLIIYRVLTRRAD